MKKVYLIVTIVLIVIACKTEKNKDYLIISGTIKNLEKESLDLKNLGGDFKKSIKVDSNGIFSDTLKIESGYYSLLIGKKNIAIYLNKNENLNIVFDEKDTVNSVVYNGKFSNENNYLFKKSETIKTKYAKAENLYALKENNFLEKINSIENDLTELANKSNLDHSFISQELRNLHYTTVTNLDNYESFHGYYANNKEFVVSESFPVDYAPKDLNNINDFNNSSDFRKIIQNHYYRKVMAQPDVSDDIYNVVYMDLVNKEATNPIIKNKLLYDNAFYGITFTTETEVFYNTFIASSTNDKHKAEITKTYTILQKTAKGKDSPKFINYENYNGGTTSLDDLKGKFVYVDVWATWCGPCKKEIPFLKEIEVLYHDKNIVFVSISVDKTKDHDAWKKMIADKEMSGIQLIADKDWKSDFVNDYNIKGIPRFILIDPESKIVSASAARPSNPKLIELFNELGI